MPRGTARATVGNVNGASSSADTRRVWLERALTVAAIGLGIYVAASMTRLLYFGYAPVPFWDQWHQVPGDPRLAHPLERNNEHIILFSRLVFALDDRLVDGDNRVNIAATYVIQLAHALVLVAIALGGRPRAAWPSLLALAAPLTLMMSAAQWENFVWGFQHQFVAVYLFGTLAFAALALCEPTIASLVLAATLGVAATLTMSNGLLVPILLVPLAAVARRPRAHVFALGVIAVALVVFFLHDYTSPSHHTHPSDALRRPVALLRYVAVYVGSPTAFRAPLIVATVTGTILVVTSAILVLYVVRHRDEVPRAALVLATVSVFILGTAALTALGRLDFGPGQALASRYATPAAVLWSTTILLMGMLAKPRARLAVVIGTLVVVVCGARTHASASHAPLERALLLHFGETALLSDAGDDDARARLFPDDALLRAATARMRARRTSIFAEPWADWLGRRLDRVATIAPEGTCVGALERVRPAPSRTADAFRVTGWAYLPRKGRRPDRVVITDAKGVVVGYAYTGTFRPDVVAARRDVRSIRVGFRGHVGARAPAFTTLHALAISDDGRVCPLSGSPTLDRRGTITSGTDATLGAGIPTVVSSSSRGFVRGGAVPTELPPEPMHTSYSERGSRGLLVLEGVALDAEQIAIRVLAGAGRGGTLSIHLTDRDDGSTWAALDDFEGFSRPVVWVVDVPASSPGGRFALRAEDADAEGWLALGEVRRVVPAAR